jgi:hypothetical protein
MSNFVDAISSVSYVHVRYKPLPAIPDFSVLSHLL